MLIFDQITSSTKFQSHSNSNPGVQMLPQMIASDHEASLNTK